MALVRGRLVLLSDVGNSWALVRGIKACPIKCPWKVIGPMVRGRLALSSDGGNSMALVRGRLVL